MLTISEKSSRGDRRRRFAADPQPDDQIGKAVRVCVCVFKVVLSLTTYKGEGPADLLMVREIVRDLETMPCLIVVFYQISCVIVVSL